MMNRKRFPKLDIFMPILGALGLLVFGACNIGPITPPVINGPPTANAGADQNVDVGERVTLSGLGSTDPDDDPLTYNWQQRFGPSVTVNDANSAQAGFLPIEDGFYELALTVTDDRGGLDTSIVKVFVGDIGPETCPRADAGSDQTVSEGGQVTLRGGNSADPNGNPLNYEWFQLSGPQVSINGVFNAEPSFATPQVTGADIDLEFELVVTNEQGCSDTDTVVITVRDRDDDPCNGVVCNDDGQFCNGVESCDDGVCVSSGDPCSMDTFCNETTDTCDECLVDTDCDDGDACTDDACANGNCSNTAVNCDDGLFCNGEEACEKATGDCVSGIIVDCDDGLFCNGTETCDEDLDACGAGEAPCQENETCDEDIDECVDSLQIIKQAQVDTACRASGIVISPDESKLYVACWESPPDGTVARVLEYSLPDLTRLQTIPTSSNHGEVVVSADGSRIFFPNYYPSTVTQVELDNMNAMTNLSTANSWPAGISITPDKTKVLASVGQDGRSYDMGNDSIAIYDISGGSFSLLASVELQDEPRSHSLGVSQDSRFAYVATRKRQSSNPKLYEVSLEAPFGVTRTLDFPEASNELAYTRSLGNFVYVSDAENAKVWVVDRTSWTKVGYDMESAPRALEVHPSGEYLFALMPDIGAVVALDVASMSIVARYDSLSSSANDIEFNNDGTQMYIVHRSSAGEIMVFDL